MKKGDLFLISFLLGAIATFIFGDASAQTISSHQKMHGEIISDDKGQHRTHEKHQSGHRVLSQHHDSEQNNAKPALPGQDAFGAIQEIVSILEADSSTDWNSVNLSMLRDHLADMNHLILNAQVRENRIDGGLEMIISGEEERTLKAIKSMVPAHASTIDGLNGWKAKAEVTVRGARLAVTAKDTEKATHIRGLGFYGIMVTGSHHQIHHLELARGNNVHAN